MFFDFTLFISLLYSFHFLLCFSTMFPLYVFNLLGNKVNSDSDSDEVTSEEFSLGDDWEISGNFPMGVSSTSGNKVCVCVCVACVRLYMVTMCRQLSSCLLYSWIRLTWTSNMEAWLIWTRYSRSRYWANLALLSCGARHDMSGRTGGIHFHEPGQPAVTCPVV